MPLGELNGNARTVKKYLNWWSSSKGGWVTKKNASIFPDQGKNTKPNVHLPEITDR